MKTLINILAVSTLAVLSSVAYAQTEPIWRNDPTYSTHNYKHPNKAAAAKRQAMKPGVAVSFPQPGAVQVANYKMPQPGQRPVGGVVLPHKPGTDLADRNYKTPRISRQSMPSKPAVAETPVTSADNNTGN